MSGFSRRRWLESIGVLFAAGNLPTLTWAMDEAKKTKKAKSVGQPLQLVDFQPKSMLHVPETKVPRSKYPLIDIHTHICFNANSKNGVGIGDTNNYLATADELLPTMDKKNIRIMVNLTSGSGKALDDAIAKYQTPHPDRFVMFTEPWWVHTNEPGYSNLQADEIQRAHKVGAKGLKILKTLGLYLRENVTTGPLVKIDDPRFDSMWEACGALGMPVAIHVSDPEAFFLPIDRFNERFEELNNHPDWSFHGKDFPSNMEILEARNRMMARHPKTQFIVLHVGNDAENLQYVSECMDKYPNMHVEIAARIGELGRQPRQSRKFFDKYQDRILFGTDAVPHGDEFPQQVFNEQLYEIYYRFLETEDEYFDYAPAPVPPQGRWRIYGLGLPDSILKKVYYENAARMLKIAT